MQLPRGNAPGWCSVTLSALPFLDGEMLDFVSRHLALNVRPGKKTQLPGFNKLLKFSGCHLFLTCTYRSEGIFLSVSLEILYERNAL